MEKAAYDEIADWYAEWVDGDAGEFSERTRAMLEELLENPNTTNDVCIDIACGTGVRAHTLRELGWNPRGVDLSRGQLRHATAKLPVAMADATRLPIRSNVAGAATAILCHTDLEDYRAVVREAARALNDNGKFVHIGVHPAFTGAFADREDPARIIVDAGYLRRERRWDSFTPHGVRAKVGAWHMTITDLMSAILDAGLTITKIREAGPDNAVPDILGIAARK